VGVATVLPANAADRRLEWITGNPAVATVSNGVVRAHRAGQAHIVARARDGSGVLRRITVTVRVPPGIGGSASSPGSGGGTASGDNNAANNNLTAFPRRIVIGRDQGAQLAVTRNGVPVTSGVSWSSSSLLCVWIHPTSGHIIGRRATGKPVMITARVGGEVQNISVTVTQNQQLLPAWLGIHPGTTTLTTSETLQLSASFRGTNGNPFNPNLMHADNRGLILHSSNTNIATVSANGLVTPRGAGTVTITARAANGVTGQHPNWYTLSGYN